MGAIQCQACVCIKRKLLLYEHLNAHAEILEIYGNWVCNHEIDITR